MFNDSRSSSRQKENKGYPPPKNVVQKETLDSLLKDMSEMSIGPQADSAEQRKLDQINQKIKENEEKLKLHESQV